MWIPTSSREGGNAYGTGALIFCSYILGVGVIVFVMTTNEKFALLLNHFASTVGKLLPQLGLSGLILLSGMTLLAITRVHGKITEQHNAEVLYKCRRLCSLIIYVVICACLLLLAHAYILEDSVSWVTRAVVAGVNFFALYVWLHYIHSRVLVLEGSMAATHGGRHGRFGTTPTVTVANVEVLPWGPTPIPMQDVPSPLDCQTVSPDIVNGSVAPPPPYSEVFGVGIHAAGAAEYNDPGHQRSITPPPCYKDTELAKKINDA